MSATHSIPDVGELGSADRVPAKVQVAKVTVGPATTNDLVLTSTGIYTLFANKDGLPILVKKIWTQINEAFTASVTLDIGDTASAARLAPSTVIVPQSTGAVLVVSDAAAIATVPYLESLDITLDVEAALPAAGQMDVYMEYALMSD